MTGPVLAEWEQVASTFGVAMEQVRRDHLISHVLAAISAGVSSDHSCSLVARRCRAPILPTRGSVRTST